MQPYGGVSRYWFELLQSMTLYDGPEMMLFAGLHFSRLPIERLSPMMNVVSMKLPFVPSRGRGLIRSFSGACCRWQLSWHKPTIYHATYFDMIPSPKQTKRVLTVHDMISEKFYGLDAHASRQKRRTLEMADYAICISEATKNDLLQYFPSFENRCTVIHHGTTELPPPKADLNLPEYPYVLYVGARRGYKNFRCLVQALKIINQARVEDIGLLCFGGGDFTNEEIEQLSMAGLIQKTRRVQGGDDVLAAAYAHTKAMVYPSLYEGFGLPILEAMTAGCPVICGNTSSLPEVAGDAALYFDPTSAEDLATRIQFLIEDNNVTERLKILGYRRAGCFSWEKAAQATLEVYECL